MTPGQLIATVQQAHAAYELALANERAGQAALDRSRTLLARNQERVNLGLLPQLDLTSAELTHAQARFKLKQAQRAFRAAMGEPDWPPETVASPFSRPSLHKN